VLRAQLDRQDALDGQVDDLLMAVAAADQVEASSIDGERVGVEDVDPAHPPRAAIVDAQLALLDQPAQDAVDRVVEVAVVLLGKGNGVELALQAGE
jgi:hypothetical protein